MSYNVGGNGAYYHDAPESMPLDNGHNAPEAVPYIEHYAPNEKSLNSANPKMMEVGAGSRRRLGDMSASKFWIILGVVCALVIAATVGGAVGGTLAARKGRESSESSSASSSTASAAEATSSSSRTSSTTTSTSTTSVAPLATIFSFPAPSTDCTNGTTYDSLFQNGENGTPRPGTGLTFTRLCGQDAKINNIGSAFVYSLEDCIEICAGINFWPGNRRCTSVVYRPEGKGKPVNCWAANTTTLTGSNEGLYVGLLQ